MEGGKKARVWTGFYIGIIAVLAIALVFVLYTGTGITGNAVAQNQATDRVKEIYSLLTERDVEVLSAKEESGIYRVVVRTTDLLGNPAVQDVFITKDGKLVTDKLISAEDYRRTLEGQKNFTECLREKGVVVAGLSSNNYTALQLNELGNYWYKIYLDCGGSGLETCRQVGIQNIPSVLYNQTIYEGAKTVEWFEDLTGCRLEK